MNAIQMPGAFFDGTAGAIAVQPDGKIVVAGSVTESASAPFDSKLYLARFNANGSVDTSFGTGGRSVIQIGPSIDGFNALAIQADGKLVAVGRNEPDPNSSNAEAGLPPK
jgi:uncharacterized delta-60 repeat protein